MSPTIIKVILLTVVVQIGCVSNRVSCSLDALYEQASALEVGIMMALFAFVRLFLLFVPVSGLIQSAPKNLF